MQGRLHWTVLAVLVGCSGAASITDPSAADGGARGDAHDDASWDSGLPDGAADVQLDAPSDVGADAGKEDANDASSSNRDADADAQPIDGAVDAMPDVGTDSGEPTPHDAGPPTCHDGAGRCREFKREVCTRGDWQWQVGDQQCCVEPGRYASSGNTVTDSTTGKTWSYGSGKATGRGVAESSCASRLRGGRLPTTTEMLALVIGRPDGNIAVCSPTIDQAAFPYVYPGPHFASPNECVDMNHGATVACPPPGESTAYLCITP